jgi:hypothetical protein
MPQAPPDSSDDRMIRNYVLVVLCEALTIAALWTFGRIFS